MRRQDKLYSELCLLYPKAKTALSFISPWQMLVATILSAQCTDKRVNEITSVLFSEYPDIDDYLNMRKETLIKHIRSAGFYNNKAKNIMSAARKINSDFSGKVPRSIKELVTIPGVARKTANVVLSNAFGISEGIAVDTHVKRLAFRLALTKEKDPVKIELELMRQFESETWSNLTHVLIEHGRSVCKAAIPACTKCSLAAICEKKGVDKSK